MDKLLEEEEIKCLQYLPKVKLVDPEKRLYHLYNRLAEAIPSIIFKGNEVNQMGTMIFSGLTDNANLIPQYMMDGEKVTMKLWEEVSMKGAFKLKDGEDLHMDMPVHMELDEALKLGEGKKTTVKPVKINPDVLIADVYTLFLVDGCDIQFILSEANQLKVDRITFREPEEGLEERQKLRRDVIRRANDIIQTHVTLLSGSAT